MQLPFLLKKIKVFFVYAVYINMASGDINFNSKENFLNESLLKEVEIQRSKLVENGGVGELFDFFNTSKFLWKKKYLDGEELSNMLAGFKKAAGEDGVFSSAEINKYIKDNNLSGKVSAKSIKKFVNQINLISTIQTLHNDISGLGTTSAIKEHLQNIPKEKISEVLMRYENEYKTTLIQDIANEFGSRGKTREGLLNIIRDKIYEFKKPFSPSNANKFKNTFDAEVKNIDMTWMLTAGTKKLDKIVNEHIKQPYFKDPEYIEKENRDAIRQIMSDPKLCWTTADREKIISKIMKYAKKTNPKALIKEKLKSNNEMDRTIAKKLLESNFLEYYPLFVACIIAQESQFREKDAAVFTANGQGVMQITEILTQDMFNNPKAFDTEFINYIKDNYNDSAEFYSAIKNQNNVMLNYYTGTAGLKAKMNDSFRLIRKGVYDSFNVNLTEPSVILELTAMNYNGNSAGKKDEKHSKGMSIVQRVYARDVIERFRKYTPMDIKVRNYFDYNPKDSTYHIVKE